MDGWFTQKGATGEVLLERRGTPGMLLPRLVIGISSVY